MVASLNYAFEALVRIHARACMVSSEVRVLMVAGHAGGALARWRTLHELAVVAYFIKEHGSNVAERYMLHEAVVSAKAAEQYERHRDAMGYPPLDPDELKSARDIKAALLHRFGADHADDYGWAGGVLTGRPDFARIDEAVGLSHWRPHYKMASHGVHTGFKGMTFDVGQGGVGHDVLMISGASNAGLIEPGDSVLLDLFKCTVALVNHKPTEKAVVQLKVLMHLQQDARDAFVRIHDQMERNAQQHGAT